MSDEEASASPEESVGDASEAPEEEEGVPRLGLAFTDLTIESMEALADATTVKDKLRILCELTEVNHYQDNTWSGVFVDYLYYGLAFASERSFSDEQTSALFSILKNVFEHAFPVEPDTNSLPLEESHAFFKEQMLTHSVDDAEAGCIQIYSVEDVTQISNFLSTTFYRHYNSYKYAYTTTQPEETVHHSLIVETPLPPDATGTDMAGATERLAHVADCRPEICTLDCGTMNFGHGDYIMTNSTSMLVEMAKQMQALGVKPEIEAFDTGHLWFAKYLAKQGHIDSPALVQLCMGIPWGAPDDLGTLMAMVNNVPSDWVFSAFSIGRNAMAYPAASVLAGGNVRVGLEDNLYLSRGVFATNAQLVEKAVNVVENMGANVIGPDAVRERLKLTKRAPVAR